MLIKPRKSDVISKKLSMRVKRFLCVCVCLWIPRPNRSTSSSSSDAGGATEAVSTAGATAAVATGAACLREVFFDARLSSINKKNQKLFSQFLFLRGEKKNNCQTIAYYLHVQIHRVVCSWIQSLTVIRIDRFRCRKCYYDQYQQ